MSDLQGRRIPGEEGSGRRRPWLWIVLGLILLLLLALLIPFACQNGGSGGGSGAQGGADENAGERAGGAEGKAQESGAEAANDPDGSGDREAGSGGPQEVATAQLSVRDQRGGGEAVTVPAATVEGAKGWLAVRAADGGEPGKVLGYEPLREGANEDVRVALDRPVASSQRLYATVHAETPADGDFTYPDGDPTLEQGGRAAIEPISYTVEGAASGEASSGGIRENELPESGGPPPAALMAGSLLLLAAGAWGVRRAAFR